MPTLPNVKHGDPVPLTIKVRQCFSRSDDRFWIPTDLIRCTLVKLNFELKQSLTIKLMPLYAILMLNKDVIVLYTICKSAFIFLKTL